MDGDTHAMRISGQPGHVTTPSATHARSTTRSADATPRVGMTEPREGSSSRLCDNHDDVTRHRGPRQLVPRVAIIMSGTLRRLGNWSSDGWTSIAQHVITPLLDASEVATFVCIGESDPLPPEEVTRALHITAVLRNETETSQRCVQDGPSCRHAQAYYSQGAQTERAGSCFLFARQHVQSRGERPFAWFLRLRPDLLLFATIPHLSTYSPLHVSVRARSLHGGSSTRRMRGKLVGNLLISIEYLSVVRMGCERNSRCTMQAVPRPCLVPDDTFAVVPYWLAPSYFLFEPAPRDAPPAAAACAHRPRNISSPLPPWGDIHWHSDWGNETECHACLKCEKKFCQEYLSASAWAKAGVPFELRAFRARIHPGAEALANGVCSSDERERCKDVKDEKYNRMPLLC